MVGDWVIMYVVMHHVVDVVVEIIPFLDEEEEGEDQIVVIVIPDITISINPVIIRNLKMINKQNRMDHRLRRIRFHHLIQ